MIWILSIIGAALLFAVLMIIGSVAGGAANKTKDMSDADELRTMATVLKICATALIVAWVLPQTVVSSLRQVPAGHEGIVYQFDDIVGQRSAGLQFIFPWQGFKLADVRLQKIRPDTHCFSGSIPECLEAFSKETQDVFIVPTLNISVNPTDVQDLYRNVGADYLSKLVRPRLLQIFKDETVKFAAIDLAPNREALRTVVRARLREELSPFSINVDDLLIDNMDFRPEFKMAIEAKQIATQEALKQAELIKASEAQAKQVAATALGAADKLRIEAQGQADANRLITESITPILVQWQAVQKLADNVQIALIPSGNGIIIDPAALLAPTP